MAQTWHFCNKTGVRHKFLKANCFHSNIENEHYYCVYFTHLVSSGLWTNCLKILHFTESSMKDYLRSKKPLWTSSVWLTWTQANILNKRTMELQAELEFKYHREKKKSTLQSKSYSSSSNRGVTAVNMHLQHLCSCTEVCVDQTPAPLLQVKLWLQFDSPKMNASLHKLTLGWNV